MPRLIETQFHAAIVLANLMDRQGNLNPETRERVMRGAEAIQNAAAPLLVLCGWAYRRDSDIRIADAMKRYAVQELRIPESAVLTEPASRDTVGDAVFTKRNLANPRGWSRILVITSDYHLPRSLAVFSFVYGSQIQIHGAGTATADGERNRDAEANSMLAFENTFDGVRPGDDTAIFQRLRTRHPFYNGDIHPQIAD